MGRWESGSAERLSDAALRLFTAQGFDRTTVAEIATEAGLTERTFYRHFADKPEVLFSGQEDFERLFLDALRASPASDPMDLVAAALEGVAAFFPRHKRDWSRARQHVVENDRALQERELHKMSTLGASLRTALTERGVDPTTAALAADVCVSVFRTTFTLWLEAPEPRDFGEVKDEVWQRHRALRGST